MMMMMSLLLLLSILLLLLLFQDSSPNLEVGIFRFSLFAAAAAVVAVVVFLAGSDACSYKGMPREVSWEGSLSLVEVKRSTRKGIFQNSWDFLKYSSWQ